MKLLQELHDLCIERGFSIATAESCTSGLIGSQITTISGSSSYFKGGVIAYQNTIKIGVLGVSADLIDKKTEVCTDVTEQMAINTLKKFNSDFAVATSGYAGPNGGTKENPIGTVFISIATKDKLISKRFSFNGERKSIVSKSVVKSIEFLIDEIKNQ